MCLLSDLTQGLECKEMQCLEEDTDPVQAGETIGRFWGSSPTSACAQEGKGRAVGREALPGSWAGRAPTTSFGVWGFLPISSSLHSLPALSPETPLHRQQLEITHRKERPGNASGAAAGPGDVWQDGEGAFPAGPRQWGSPTPSASRPSPTSGGGQGRHGSLLSTSSHGGCGAGSCQQSQPSQEQDKATFLSHGAALKAWKGHTAGLALP